jgi:transketolase
LTATVGVQYDLAALEAQAMRIRERILDMCACAEGGHLGGSMSLVELLTALYFELLRVDPEHPDDPDRDILVLSKGHGAIGLYATLAERGFFPVDDLETYACCGSRFAGHPTKVVPGVEMPTGSLGHGLALGAGFALGARLEGRDRRTVVIMGDGELQEGSVWEAALGVANLGLEGLTAIVDRNELQLTGRTENICRLEPLADKWESFGWSVQEVDGHDLAAILPALASTPWEEGKPSMLIAHTVKGQGVPFVAGRVAAHFVRLSPKNLERARVALLGEGRDA